jgi:hypothetical protein
MLPLKVLHFGIEIAPLFIRQSLAGVILMICVMQAERLTYKQLASTGFVSLRLNSKLLYARPPFLRVGTL